MMITAVKKDLEERFFRSGRQAHVSTWLWPTPDNETAAWEFKEELMELFPKAGDVYVDHLSFKCVLPHRAGRSGHRLHQKAGGAGIVETR